MQTPPISGDAGRDERAPATAAKAAKAEGVVPSLPARSAARRPQRSFSLHIGANLKIPGVENLTRVAPVSETQPVQPAADPFAGLPLHALAEYLGDRMMPALEAVKEEQKKQMREARLQGKEVQMAIPYVPPLLPVTRWASKDAQFRSTLVVEDESRQKARLSWYHPDDTMVPRDWFSLGLLEDLRYFNPFGLGDVVGDRARGPVGNEE